MPIHPILVHFPIALLTLSLAVELAGLARSREDFSVAAWHLQWIGTAGLVAAVVSGLLAKEAALIPPAAVPSIDLHQQAAFLTASLYAGLLFWRVAHRTRIPDPRVVYLVLTGAATILLLFTGWFGGELVYGHGIGTSMQPR